MMRAVLYVYTILTKQRTNLNQHDLVHSSLQEVLVL